MDPHHGLAEAVPCATQWIATMVPSGPEERRSFFEPGAFVPAASTRYWGSGRVCPLGTVLPELSAKVGTLKQIDVRVSSKGLRGRDPTEEGVRPAAREIGFTTA